MKNIIHICFSQATSGSLKYAVDEKIIDGEKVIALYDNFSEGPINNDIEVDKRINWLENMITDDFYRDDIEGLKENYDDFYREISKITDSDTMYFWYGSSASEICGMMYALELLKGKWENVLFINVSDVIVEHKNGVHIPRCVAEIMPEKFSEYIKMGRKIEETEHRDLLTQWRRIKKENSVLRIVKDEKVQSVGEDYFDIFILKYTGKELIKTARIVGNVLGYSEVLISDNYIFQRVKELVKAEKLNYKGAFGVMRDMEISITEKGLKYLNKDADAIKFWKKREKDTEEENEIMNEYINRGKMEEKISIAKNLLDVLEIKVISEKTGLTIGQVENLSKYNM